MPAAAARRDPRRVVVSGTVTYRGEPLEEGEILFLPIKGTKAPMSGAKIIDGQYAVEIRGGVAVGTHSIRITAYRPDPRDPRANDKSRHPDADDLPPVQYLPEKYNVNTDMELTIEPGSSELTKNFDLTD